MFAGYKCSELAENQKEPLLGQKTAPYSFNLIWRYQVKKYVCTNHPVNTIGDLSIYYSELTIVKTKRSI